MNKLQYLIELEQCHIILQNKAHSLGLLTHFFYSVSAVKFNTFLVNRTWTYLIYLIQVKKS